MQLNRTLNNEQFICQPLSILMEFYPFRLAATSFMSCFLLGAVMASMSGKIFVSCFGRKETTLYLYSITITTKTDILRFHRLRIFPSSQTATRGKRLGLTF